VLTDDDVVVVLMFIGQCGGIAESSEWSAVYQRWQRWRCDGCEDT
jgi:hypothetical protein